jgi:hypothetical protein
MPRSIRNNPRAFNGLGDDRKPRFASTWESGSGWNTSPFSLSAPWIFREVLQFLKLASHAAAPPDLARLFSSTLRFR